jgi:hypothetical protein
MAHGNPVVNFEFWWQSGTNKSRSGYEFGSVYKWGH